jgi:hypothetical protein
VTFVGDDSPMVDFVAFEVGFLLNASVFFVGRLRPLRLLIFFDLFLSISLLKDK